MTAINRNTPVATGPMVNRAQAVVPAAGGAAPQAQANVGRLAQQIGDTRTRIEEALKKGDAETARKAAEEGAKAARQAAEATNDPTLKAAFQAAERGFGEVSQKVDAAGKAAAPEKKHHGGIFGFVGDLVEGAGNLLEKAGHVVAFPLEMVGKVLDPVRDILGKSLGGLKDMIDGTLGKIPVLGSAVRFTTGLAGSLVGMVDGAVQAVTHPVELVKGLGSMAWSLMGVLPPLLNPRTLYDFAVNGKSPLESLKDSGGEVLALGKGLIGGALEDFSKGNIAGGLGRLTGDIGTFLVTDGAGAAIKGVGTAGKVAELAKASSVGVKAMKIVEAAKASSTAAKIGELAEAAKASSVGVKAAELVEAAKGSSVATKAAELVDAAKTSSVGVKAAEKATQAARWLNTTGLPKYMEYSVKGMRFVNHLGGEIFVKGFKFNRAAWETVAKYVPHADSVVAKVGNVAGKGGEIALKAGQGYMRYVDGVWTKTKQFVPGAERAEQLVKRAVKPMVDPVAARAEEVINEIKGPKVGTAAEAKVEAAASKVDNLAGEVAPGGPIGGQAALNLREGQTVRVQRGRFGQGGAIEADWKFHGLDDKGNYVVKKLDAQGNELTKSYRPEEFAALNPDAVRPIVPQRPAFDPTEAHSSLMPEVVGQVKDFVEKNPRDLANATLDGRVKLKDDFVITGHGVDNSGQVTFSVARRGPDGRLMPETAVNGVSSRQMVELLQNPPELQQLGLTLNRPAVVKPLSAGDAVSVRRSNGALEGDWKFHGQDEAGNYVVKKLDDQGRELTKTYTPDQFAELNPEYARASRPVSTPTEASRNYLDRQIAEARNAGVRTLPEGFQVPDLRERTVRVPSRSNPEGWLVSGKDPSGNVVVYKEGYGAKVVSPATLALENPGMMQGMALPNGEMVMAAENGTVRLGRMENNRIMFREVPTSQFVTEHGDSVAGFTKETVDALPTKEIVNGRPATYDPVAPLRQNPNVAKLPDLFGGEGRAAINRGHVQEMANARYNRLAPAEQQAVWALHNGASTYAEQAMLQRALGSGASVPQLGQFSQDLRRIAEGGRANYKALGLTDQVAAELDRLTPEQRVLRMTTLEGHQQFFTTSCNPTSFQIVRGELDPVYALQGNLHPEQLVGEQHSLLQGANRGADGLFRDAQGNVIEDVAYLRSDIARPVPKRSLWDRILGRNKEPQFRQALNNQGGVGSWLRQMGDQLNAMSDRTGLVYKEQRLATEVRTGANGQQFYATTRDARKAAVADLDQMLVDGKPTEIGVSWRRPDGSPSGSAHAIAVVDRRVLPTGETEFLLHDPWFEVNGQATTRTQWVKADDLINGRLGGAYDQAGAYGMLDTILKA